MDKITSSVQNADYNALFDVANGGIMTALGVFITKFIKSGGDLLDNAGGFLDKFGDILDGVGEAINAFTGQIKANTLKTIATAIGILAVSLVVISMIDSDKLTTSLGAITAMFVELMGAMSIFGKISGGKGLKDMLGMKVMASAMTTLAKALLTLAIAMKVMSTMSMEEMGVALISMTVGLAALVGAVYLLSLMPEKKLQGSANAIKKLASSLLVLSVALKIMSTMTWEEMGVALVSMTAGLAVLIGALYLLPKDMGGKAAAMIALSLAMVVLGAALKIMATMSWDDVARSLVALAGSLAILAVAMRLMKKAIPGALAMMIVAPALIVLAGVLKIMATMSWDEIARGLVVFAGSLLILAGAMLLMKSAIPGALAMLIVAPAIIVLAGALKLLGSMSWEEIARGLVALAGGFAIIGLAGLILKPLVGTILALSVAITLLGVACFAIGAGIFALGAGLIMIEAAGAGAAVALTAIVSSLISLIPYFIEQVGVGIIKLCEVIAGGADAICKAATVIIVALVDALVASVPAIVEGALVLVVSLMEALVEYTPTIVSLLFDFLIGVLKAIAEKLPDLIQAGVDLLMSFFYGVVKALGSVDIGLLTEGIMAVGFLSALVVALAAIAALTPAAMIGVLGLGAVVTELAIVLAAVGALAQIPGLEWLIGEGAKLMQKIGNAIGQFLGGIIGGIAQGISAALPQIGLDLSAFMKNAKPFIEGAKSIDPTTLDGVKSLVGIILALTAANILDGLTSWFTGGTSLVKFGEEISAFAPHIKKYADTVKGIDGSAVEASANAARTLSELAHNLPNSGGLAGFFAGENDIGSFGEQLVPFGEGMKKYSDAVADIDPDSVIASAKAAKAIAEMTASIPDSGGVVSWFAGDNSVAAFSEEMVALGKGLGEYSTAIAGIDPETVIASAKAAKAIADMTSHIPDSGGMVSWFAGDNSVAAFSEDLATLGTGLGSYSDAIVGIDVEAMVASANAAKAIAEMCSYIPNEGGVVSWFAGDNSISKFGTDLALLGAGLLGFSAATVGIVPENIVAAANAAKAIAEMASYIPNEGGVVSWFTGDNSLSKFSADLKSLGTGLSGFAAEVVGIDPATVTAAANAAKSLAVMTSNIPDSGGVVSWFAGDNSVSKFSADLKSLGTGLAGFATEVAGIEPAPVTAAANAGKSLAEMCSHIPNSGGVASWFGGEKSVSTFGEDLKALGAGLAGFSTKVTDIDPGKVTAAANAAAAIAKMTSYIPTEGGIQAWFGGEKSMSKFAENLEPLGKGIAGFATAVTGIDPGKVTAAANAAKTIAGITKTAPDDTSKLLSFGTNVGKFGKSLAAFFNQMSGIATETISSSTKAVNSVKKSVTGFEPDKLNSAAKAINAVSKAIKGLSKIDDSASSGFSKAMKAVAKEGVDALVKKLSDSGEKLNEAGKKSIQKVSDGAESKKKSAKKAFTSVITDCVEGISTKISSFESAGKDLGAGLVNGINAKKTAVYLAGYALGQQAVKGEKDGQASNSPSKLTTLAGKWLGEGLIIGMRKMEKKVYASGSNLGNTATSTISSAISKVSDAINSDIDTQPTIRPVLDLSDVRSGASSINGMFSGRTLSVNTRTVGAISASMANYQNGRNSSDVVSAINGLRKDISDMPRNTYSIGGITYDDGSNIADAVSSLVRAARIERRV
jgi:hypothetical protein